jgi:lysophospholipase L1-like esterase
MRGAAGHRPLWRTLLKAALIAFGFVAIVELSARAVGLETGFMFTVSRENCMQRSEILGIEFAPNCEGRTDGKVDTYFTTNSLGLRDTEIENDGAVRILTMGDSCTWGWGLAQEESYPRVLQRLLDERFGPGAYRVINAGIPGTTAYQGLRWLRARGLPLAPAIVIFAYGFNDQLRVGAVEEWMRTVSHNVPLQTIDDWLIDRSRMWRWLRWKTQPVPRKVAGQVPPRSSPQEYERQLAAIVELSRAHGAKPLMLEFYPRGLGADYKRAIETVSVERKVPLIVYGGPTIDVTHPTKDGARALAAEIFTKLVALGYVGAADAPPRD